MITFKFGLPVKQLLKSLLFYLIGTIQFLFASSFSDYFAAPYSELASLTLSAIGVFLLSLLFIHHDHGSLAQYGLAFSRKTSLPHFVSGVALGLSMAFVQVFVLEKTGWVRFTSSGINLRQILPVLLLFAAATAREELMFRGYALWQIATTGNQWSGQLLMSVLFVLEHRIAGLSWTNAVLGTGTGALLFGIASIESKGLALPLGIHLSWNVGQWLAGFKTTQGVWVASVTPGQEKSAYTVGLVTFMCLALLTAILIIFHYRSGANNRWNLFK